MSNASRSPIRRIAKSLASLKLAVAVVLALGGLSAWGTFVEAQFNDATAAQKIVYQSPWMLGTMAMLCVSLIAVMVDRWPWKERHTGFVLAHIGILILIAGALLTQKYGVDGSLTMGMGQSARLVAVGETDLAVYSSLDGEKYSKVFDREVDFFRERPREHPLSIPLPDAELTVIDYLPYALRDEKIIASNSKDDGAAIRFQLQNDRVNVTDWLQQPAKLRDAVKDLGPAKVILTQQETLPQTDGNAIVLRPSRAGDGSLDYEIRTARDPKRIKRGVARAGDAIETGWMGLVLRILKSLPNSKLDVTFKELASSTPLATAAAKIRFQGPSGETQERWFSMNSTLKLFTESAVYIVSYGNRRLDLEFPITLESFNVGRYQGTMRAASYESVVTAPEVGRVTISMNEPLKLRGYTFYQASFNEDEKGNPVASILSVNRDPGRAAKYLGSLLIVLGAVHMFYFKKRAAKRKSAGRADAGREGAKA